MGREPDEDGTPAEQPSARPGRRSRRGRGRSRHDARPQAADVPNPSVPTRNAPTRNGPTRKADGSTSEGTSGQRRGGKRQPPEREETGRARSTSQSTSSDAARRRSRARRLVKVEETSAGGLVVDLELDRAALIGRLDRRGRLLWSLPKGHLEAGETAEDAAIREVEEETGIRGVVMAPLGTVDFWFVAEDRRVHKTVHHFLLEARGGELSDADIEVSEVAWVPLEQVRDRLAYDGERRLVDAARLLLSDSA